MRKRYSPGSAMYGTFKDSLSNKEYHLYREHLSSYASTLQPDDKIQQFDPLFKHSLWTVNGFLQSGITGDTLETFFQPYYHSALSFWLDIAKPLPRDIAYLQKLFQLEMETATMIASHMGSSTSSYPSLKVIHNARYTVILAVAFDPTPLTTSYSAMAAQLDAKDRPRLIPIEDESSFALAPQYHAAAHTSARRKLTDYRFNICAIAVGDSLITLRLSALPYCSRLLMALNTGHYDRSFQHNPVKHVTLLELDQPQAGYPMSYQDQNHQDGIYYMWCRVLPRAFSKDVLASPQLAVLLYYACFERLVINYFGFLQKEHEQFMDRFETSKLASLTRIRFEAKNEIECHQKRHKHTRPAMPSLGEFWQQRRKLAHLRKYLVPHLELVEAMGLKDGDACIPGAMKQLAIMESDLNRALEEHCQVAELTLIASCSYRDTLLKKLAVMAFISLPITVISALFSMNIPLPWVYADPVALQPLAFLYYYNYSATPFYFTLMVMLVLSLLNMLLLRSHGFLDGWNFFF